MIQNSAGMAESTYVGLKVAWRRQCPGRFLGIIGQNPSVSKSNRLYVVIFRFFFIDLRNISRITVKRSVNHLEFQPVIPQISIGSLELAAGSPRSLDEVF